MNPVLFQILVGKLSTLHHWVLCCLGVVIHGFYCYVLSIPALVVVFIMNVCWIFTNVFSCIYWGDHVVFIFCWFGVSHCFAYTEPPLWPWDDCNLIVVYDLLFFIYIHQIHWLVIFLFVFVCTWYQGDGGFIEWLWQYPLLIDVLKELEMNQDTFSVELVEFPSEAI